MPAAADAMPEALQSGACLEVLAHRLAGTVALLTRVSRRYRSREY